MTLDSLVNSLGSSSRNVGAHSLVLVQQQQVAAAQPSTAQNKFASKGAGGGIGLLQCCMNRLLAVEAARTRCVIVLSLEQPASSWFFTPKSRNSTPAFVLDACTNRFQLFNATTTAAARAPSSSTSTTVQTLSHAEINSLHSLRSIIFSTAQKHQSSATATPAAAHSTTAHNPVDNSDPFAVATSLDDGSDSFSCDSVTLIIDDLMSLFVRFGERPTLAFLQSLKSSPLNLLTLTCVDLDGLTTLPPLLGGTGTENVQAQFAQVSLHAHLAHLATSVVSIRSVTPMDRSLSVAPSFTPTTQTPSSNSQSSSPSSVFAYSVHVLHKRPSGKSTSVNEEMEVHVQQGVVKKLVAASAVASGTTGGKSSSGGSSVPASLVQQFGSSFNLDLTSKAASARAATLLPFQHTSDIGNVTSVDAVEDDDDLLEDSDEDFDDPDDDLEI